MHPEGVRFVFIAAAIAVAAAAYRLPLGIAGLLLAYGVYLFFRDPERVQPSDPSLVVSPADGIVCLLTQTPVPSELGAADTPVWLVSFFMSVINVHVNRLRAAGNIYKTH